MKAVVFRRYKFPDSLELIEASTPIPKENEVLVRIHAASVNSWDWDILHGVPFVNRMGFGLIRPREKIIGCDMAGTVENVGRQVKDWQTGDEVMGDISGYGMGAFAGYVCVSGEILARKPDGMTFAEAAAMSHTGLLALQGLRYQGHVQKGKQVLINGAGGGSGTMAVQIAKSYGAEVTAVDSGTKLEMLRSLGADHVIDYKRENFTEGGKCYDLILDVVTFRSIFDYRRILHPGGAYVMLGGGSYRRVFQCALFGPLITMRERLTHGEAGRKMGLLVYKPNRKDLEVLITLFNAGAVVPVIDKSFALSEVRDAFRYYGAGIARGKVVIIVDGKLQAGQTGKSVQAP